MYRAIIVDDDRWALEDMKKSFDFAAHGFVLSGEYSGAEAALSSILFDPPDLVVSDIRMDARSGLDMIRDCREMGVRSLFVLVSGYDDFEYVQAAFRYDVFYYMLKPIDDAQAAELMERVRARLDSEAGRPAYPDDCFGRALRYVDAHYAASLPLDTVASALHVNRSYLSDLFSKRMGMTFTQYKNSLRVRQAREMIASGAASLTDVALACGFDSLSRFSKVFKQVTGVSPQQFRKGQAAGE